MSIKTFLGERYDELVQEASNSSYAGTFLRDASREDLLAVLAAQEHWHRKMTSMRQQTADFMASIGRRP